MTDEERKMHFGFLVEQILYKNLQLISESTLENKNELAVKQILEFYKEYKDEYNIENIKEIEDKLEEIKKNVEKIKGSER